MNILPVILSGGSGTRLWPLSRERYPKQLLRLAGNHTMLQATALRLAGMQMNDGNELLSPLLIGNEEYRFLMAQQMQEIGVEHPPILIEPCGRNTAPALTLAALTAQAHYDDPILVVMPADHVIQDIEAFHAALNTAIVIAKTSRIVTFGIVPTAPETGYGYIQLGNLLDVDHDQPDHAGKELPHTVARFVEKPDLDTAQAYLSQGNYLWNSGLFVVRASVWLEALSRYRADIMEACRAAYRGCSCDRDFCSPEKAAFQACPSESIDYAVMEPLSRDIANQDRVAVVPLAAKWSDVGTWSAIWQIGEKDAQQNVMLGDVLSVNTTNTLVVGQDRLIATVGVDGLVVVETADAVLVADLNSIQQVKDIVNKLRQDARGETHSHRKIHRPWGWYDSIDYGHRFQVKRIVVNPGASLSLQLHHHRAEHWVVVSGTARITRGDETYLVSENESTYIPIGTKHRLENPGKLPLEIIEVQSGAYLGEDDIVRIDDLYGRNQ